ncbi:MAG: hypothetical protein KBD37_03910 [Burkholderiales bacterium]|nr:hypothetical protein [Burkholderiales bacterium]
MLVINRNVEIKASAEWLKSSFSIFREKPIQFIVLGLINILIGLIPGLGAFLAPLFTAQFAQLTLKIEKRHPVLMSNTFENFFANKKVLYLGLINLCATTLLFTLQYIMHDHLGDATSNPLAIQINPISLAYLIPMIILQMSLWLSPLICLYNEDITPLQAMWLSIKACGFNIITLLIYSLLVIFFTILAIIPFGIGLIIWLPIMDIVVYFIYKTLFTAQHMKQ